MSHKLPGAVAMLVARLERSHHLARTRSLGGPAADTARLYAVYIRHYAVLKGMNRPWSTERKRYSSVLSPDRVCQWTCNETASHTPYALTSVLLMHITPLHTAILLLFDAGVLNR